MQQEITTVAERRHGCHRMNDKVFVGTPQDTQVCLEQRLGDFKGSALIPVLTDDGIWSPKENRGKQGKHTKTAENIG